MRRVYSELGDQAPVDCEAPRSGVAGYWQCSLHEVILRQRIETSEKFACTRGPDALICFLKGS